MRMRLLWCVMVLFMSAGFVGAAEAKPAIPGNVLYHVAVKAPGDFLSRLDGTVSAVTADTRNPVPPGFVSMMAQMQIPMADVLFGKQSGTPWHLMLVEGSSVPVIFMAVGADELAEGLGVELAPGENGKLRVAVLPQLGETCFFEGDGYVALTDSGNSDELLALVEALGDWSAEYTYGGDVYFRGELPEGWPALLMRDLDIDDMLEEIASLRSEEIKEDKKKFDDELAGFGINPKVVDGFLLLIENHTTNFFGELGEAKRGALVLGLSEKRIGLEGRLDFDSPSFGAELAANSAARGPIDARPISVADGAMAMGVAVSAEQMIPGYADCVRRFSREIVQAMFPSFSERMEKLVDEIVGLKLGDSLTATDMTPDGQVSVMWVKTENAAKILDLQKEMAAIMNGMLNEAVTKPEYEFAVTTVDGVTAAGVNYVKTTFNARDAAAFVMAAANEGLSGVNEVQMLHALYQLAQYAYYGAAKDGVFVSVSGIVDEDDLVDALGRVDTLDNPPEPGALLREAVDSVGASRDMLAVVDVDKALEAFGREFVKAAESSDGGAEYSERFQSFMDGMKRTGAFGAFGVGALDGMMSVSISLPIDGVNAVWSAVEKLNYIIEQARENAYDDEEWEHDGEEYDEDGSGDDAESDESVGA